MGTLKYKEIKSITIQLMMVPGIETSSLYLEPTILALCVMPSMIICAHSVGKHRRKSRRVILFQNITCICINVRDLENIYGSECY